MDHIRCAYVVGVHRHDVRCVRHRVRCYPRHVALLIEEKLNKTDLRPREWDRPNLHFFFGRDTASMHGPRHVPPGFTVVDIIPAESQTLPSNPACYIDPLPGISIENFNFHDLSPISPVYSTNTAPDLSAIEEHLVDDLRNRLNNYVHSNGVSFYNRNVNAYPGKTLRMKNRVA